jgi:hypothetical protein
MPTEPVNLFEYEGLAKQKLDQGPYDFIAGGATDEITKWRWHTPPDFGDDQGVI